jgi:serine/threonine protein kinase
MSPEAAEHPDTIEDRSDLDSLGAGTYHPLTDGTEFSGATLGDVLMPQVKAVPENSSACLREPLSPVFEEVLMRCLTKQPADRPASDAALEALLAPCAATIPWGTRARRRFVAGAGHGADGPDGHSIVNPTASTPTQRG